MTTAATPLDLAAASYFAALQQRIISAFEGLEPAGQRFTQTPWQKPSGERLQGHGLTALMRATSSRHVFEKVGVNFSQVHGVFPEPFRREIPGADASHGHFWASGISLVAHMQNPYAPSVHMNVRRLVTSRGWFGGGADLTPTFPFAEDTDHFHTTLERACEAVIPGSHAKYQQWCREYFFLPHRNEERGVGGVFFDYLEPDEQTSTEKTFDFTRAVGDAFLPAFLPLVELRNPMPYSATDKHQQNLKRGRYAEFNLLYDRGTRFGLQSGGNTEAILMSLPPTACW